LEAGDKLVISAETRQKEAQACIAAFS
jgi:hypothetical protein